jgi:CRP-like cAMP-binding protein
MQQTENLSKALNTLGNFIHQIQKERGYASVYLQGEDSFREKIESQFSLVDKAISALTTLFKSKNSSYEITNFLLSLKKINDERKHVIARLIDSDKIIFFYTKEIIAPAINIISELAIFNSQINADKISAYINFLQWKEKIGCERAVGAKLTMKNCCDDSVLIKQIRHLISEQNAYQRMFTAFVDEKNKSFLEEKFLQDESLKKIEEINKIILAENKPSKKLENISLSQWFLLFTAKMDLLHEVEKKLIANLDQPTEEKLEKIEPEKIIDSQKISKNILEYIDLIKTLPTFIGLSKTDIQKILEHSYIRDHKKGTLLFLEGEQPVRFYIILEGWIKLFRGNEDGEETVLQMVGEKKGIVETAILLGTPMPVSAKVVENAKILSIPSSAIREYIKSNRDLASNMLSTMAQQSKELINKLGLLTLKSAEQRLGWFLLNLFLENDKQLNEIRLPYDKSLIASYLGMKPETLSRALQLLKENDSISIDRNIITLSNIFSLCEYCDSETGEKCKLHNTEKCPNFDYDDSKF